MGFEDPKPRCAMIRVSCVACVFLFFCCRAFASGVEESTQSAEVCEGGVCRAGEEPGAAECYTHETEDIVEWVRAHGGFVHKHLRIQKGPIGRGFLATAAIPKGVDIVSVPVELIIKESQEHPCYTVAKLRNEMRLGKCSKYWPYLKFMDEVELDNPDLWSPEELALLDGLPPGDWQLHTTRLVNDCGPKTDLELSDPVAVRALLLYVTRSGSEGMQPIFDIFNHGYNSTWHFMSKDNSHHVFQTNAHIAAGSEVFNQFRPGAGPGRNIVTQMMNAGQAPDGAPEIFRDYGFVERSPTFWWFESEEKKRHSFVIEDDDGAVWWPPTRPKLTRADYAALVDDGTKLLEKLEKFDSEAQQHPPEVTNARRHALAWEYRRAFGSALRAAVSAAKQREGKASGTHASKGRAAP